MINGQCTMGGRHSVTSGQESVVFAQRPPVTGQCPRCGGSDPGTVRGHCSVQCTQARVIREAAERESPGNSATVK